MDKQLYLNIVEAITASKSFGRSDTYANMLKYLVEATLNNKTAKETTIASDIFGKENFDPSQSTLIRVYAYNLRKKLAKYYENEGVNDTIVLEIPKGNYEVKFIDKTPAKKTVKTNKSVILLGLIIGITLLSIFFLFNAKQSSKIILWEDILKSHKTSMLVLGDLFIYKEIDSITGKPKTIRNASINSKEEFENLKSDSKSLHIEPLNYSFNIRNSVNWVKDLDKVFYKAEKDFVIRNMSRFNPKELSDNNLVVVGMLKTFGLFKDYVENEGYTVTKDKIIYTHKKTGTKQIFAANGDADGYHTDYALILKVPGPNNNSIYLFGGIWDTGASQSLKNFTDFKLAKDLEKTMTDKFGEIPENYKILLEVSGIDRMELNSKIIHLEKVE